MNNLNGARLRLGIVGCGKITEYFHLPAALATPGVEVVALCDANPKRLQAMLRRYSLTARAFRNHLEAIPHIDAAIVATPTHLHDPIATDFLTQGIHVLCEKPLAASSVRCEVVTRVAAEHAAVLAVGHFTRFLASTELTKELIECGDLGALISFDYEFGAAKGWASHSGYNLRREMCGGGVLLDNGVHVIDRLRYWFPHMRLVGCRHDSRGGIEANCIVDFETAVNDRSVVGQITMSLTHRLGNRLRVVGTEGSLTVRDGQQDTVTLTSARRELQHEITWAATGSGSSRPTDPFQAQLEDFVDAIRTGRPPRITGETATAAVRLIEECYRIATPLEEPWMDTTIERLRQTPLELTR
jgi:predicted dehydrogenase